MSLSLLISNPKPNPSLLYCWAYRVQMYSKVHPPGWIPHCNRHHSRCPKGRGQGTWRTIRRWRMRSRRTSWETHCDSRNRVSEIGAHLWHALERHFQHTSLSLCLCFFFFFDFLCECKEELWKMEGRGQRKRGQTTEDEDREREEPMNGMGLVGVAWWIEERLC